MNNTELDQYLNEGDNFLRYLEMYYQFNGDQRGWRNLSRLCRQLATRAYFLTRQERTLN